MEEDIYSLLEMLIKTNTENPPGREEVLVDNILEWLEPWKPRYKKVPIETGRSCLLVWLEGQREEYIGFAGHLDTVPAGDRAEWQHDPFSAERAGNIVYGRGATDMKGGVAAMLLLYRYYREKNEKPPYGILFMFTADEEAQGKGIAELCKQNEVKQIKALFVCEPTGNTLGLGEMGTLWLKFSVNGIGCHASMSSLGVNALEEGIQIVEKFQKEWKKKSYSHPLLGKESCSLTKLSGGVKINMIPEKAEFYLDIRTVPRPEENCQRHGELLELAEHICKNQMAEKEGLSVSVEVLTDRPAIEMKRDSSFIESLLQSAEKEKKVLECSAVRFFTDASIVLKNISVPFVIFGPGDPKECHTTDEKIEISQIEEAIEYYKIFIEGMGETRVF